MGSWLDIDAVRPRRPRRGHRGLAEVRIYGPLNMLTVAEQEQRIFAAMTGSDADVLLDLTHVTRVTAVGLQMVRYVQSVLHRTGRDLVLVGDHPDLHRRLRELGVDMVMPVYATRALALASR